MLLAFVATAWQEAVGIDGPAIAKLVADIRAGKYSNIHSLLVVRSGKVVVERHDWIAYPDGAPIAASGLRLLPRDMANFGLLYLNGGQRIMLLPSLDVVMVLTAGMYRNRAQTDITFEVLLDGVLPAIGKRSVP